VRAARANKIVVRYRGVNFWRALTLYRCRANFWLTEIWRSYILTLGGNCNFTTPSKGYRQGHKRMSFPLRTNATLARDVTRAPTRGKPGNHCQRCPVPLNIFYFPKLLFVCITLCGSALLFDTRGRARDDARATDKASWKYSFLNPKYPREVWYITLLVRLKVLAEVVIIKTSAKNLTLY